MAEHLVITLPKIPHIHRVYGSGQPYICGCFPCLSHKPPTFVPPHQVLGTVLKIPLPSGSSIACQLFQAPVTSPHPSPSPSSIPAQDQPTAHVCPSSPQPVTPPSTQTPLECSSPPQASFSSRVQLLALLAPSSAVISDCSASPPPTSPSSQQSIPHTAVAATTWACWLLEQPPLPPYTSLPACPDQIQGNAPSLNFPSTARSDDAHTPTAALPALTLVAHSTRSILQAREGCDEAISYSHQPSCSSGSTGVVLTGSHGGGKVEVWQPHPHGLAPPSPQLCLNLAPILTTTQLGGSNSRSSTSCTPATPSCVAWHKLAGLCAVAVPPTSSSLHGSLHICCAQAAITDRGVSEGCRQRVVEGSHGVDGCVSPAEAQHGRPDSDGEVAEHGVLLNSSWVHEAVLPLPEKGVPCALVWLPPSCMPVPCLALAYTTGR
jgi:hypothetical protein